MVQTFRRLKYILGGSDNKSFLLTTAIFIRVPWDYSSPFFRQTQGLEGYPSAALSIYVFVHHLERNGRVEQNCGHPDPLDAGLPSHSTHNPTGRSSEAKNGAGNGTDCSEKKVILSVEGHYSRSEIQVCHGVQVDDDGLLLMEVNSPVPDTAVGLKRKLLTASHAVKTGHRSSNAALDFYARISSGVG